MTAERPALQKLAERLGILPGYRGVDGRDRSTSDATREALVAAMGHEADSEAAALRCLETLERADEQRLLAPVLVWREWEHARPELSVNARALAGARDYAIELALEDGRRVRVEGRLQDSPGAGTLRLALPENPPLGYHDVRLELDAPGGALHARQRLVMAPRRAFQPGDVLGERKAYGISVNLYAVRLPGDWGHGGMRALAELGRFAGRQGAAFVGINPLHAVSNRGLDFSPYSPTSRLYRNPLYLDPEAVPELAASPAARARLREPALRERRALLEAADRIDHAAVLDAMLPVLQELHASFRRAAPARRRAAYAAYLEREGSALRDFAAWEVIAEEQAEPGGPPCSEWWRWPAPLRDPRSSAVEAFRERHADAVDFRCWLQFELDRQLAETARGVRESGCPLGIYQDLAVGSSRASADTWMAQHCFARAVTVGAPPDDYAWEGQEWGLPPFDPHRLRAEGYASWIRLVRSAFAHAGMLRIDHVMGLLRLFWIPEGRSGADGAYVSYRAEELLGVLALESRRQRTLVVGEDLGTVPPELPGLLEEWGLLRSSVLYFERAAAGFRPSATYPARALATAGTHDLAPLEGLLAGADLELRRRLGGFASPGALEEARREREATISSLHEVLRRESLLPPDREPAGGEVRDAVHGFLAKTPAVLVGVSLEDLAGESEPVNLPGVALERHRSWSRRMRRSLPELVSAPELRASLEPLRSRRVPEPEQR